MSKPKKVAPFDRTLLRAGTANILKWFKLPPQGLVPLRLGILPDKIYPVDFVIRSKAVHPVEIMLLALMEGAWIKEDEDWRDYARVLIALRLRKKSKIIFREGMESWKSKVLQFQMYGGTIAEQKAIRDHAKRLITVKDNRLYVKAYARLILSLTDPQEDNRVFHPLHWIRTVIATLDRQPNFGMSAYQVEMLDQKKTLQSLVESGLPKT